MWEGGRPGNGVIEVGPLSHRLHLPRLRIDSGTSSLFGGMSGNHAGKLIEPGSFSVCSERYNHSLAGTELPSDL